jgi:hypothetical protein
MSALVIVEVFDEEQVDSYVRLIELALLAYKHSGFQITTHKKDTTHE